ncbi:MAG TPA: hypothetical protein HA258_00205 [Thermoplasmata archaeon]|nr:hypothetical protein [Thermoplasmata archaeon]
MRKLLILFFILGLVFSNGIPLTIGSTLRDSQQVSSRGEESFNLNLDIDADRHVSPHSYGEGVKASFLVTIWNTGQNESTTCNVTCSIIRLCTIGFFNFDREPEEMQQIEWTENSMDPRTGHSKTISFGCPIQNGIFAIYKIHARIDTKDSNSEDNSDSFIFFVVWVGWVDRWIDIID